MSYKLLNDQTISQIKDISKLAGIEIMKIYKTDFSVSIKIPILLEHVPRCVDVRRGEEHVWA